MLLSKRRNIAIINKQIPMNEEYLSKYYKNYMNTKQKDAYQNSEKFARQNI